MTLRIPTIFDALSVAGLDLGSQLLADAEAETENVIGRFDVPHRVPDRNLTDILPQDVDRLRKLGAVYADGRWTVPPTISDLRPFEPWWPKVPEDLRDTRPQLLLTKDGRVAESYILPEDLWKGQDSTATPLMFAALPLVAALSFLALHVSSALALATLLLAVPFLVTIWQGEGVWEAVKGGLLVVVPLVLTTTSCRGLTPMLGVGPLWTPLVIVGSLFAFFMNATKHGFAAAFEAALKFVAWTFALSVAIGLASLLPAGLQPVILFAAACSYPMFYTERNYRTRAHTLKKHGERFNLGNMGRIAQSHVVPRQQQAFSAHQDKSPLITFGEANGHLTTKQYGFAPDAKTPMRASIQDLSTHLLSFGTTGSGKTSCVLRPLALQVAEACVGMFLADGKGALAGELAGILDLGVRPGIDLGLIEGLDAQGVTQALISAGADKRRKSSSDPIWENGAAAHIDHMTVLHEALRDHELSYRQHAVTECQRIELEQDWTELEVIRLEQAGEDSSSVVASLDTLREKHAAWSEVHSTERVWTWDIHTLDRLVLMSGSCRKHEGVAMPSEAMIEVLSYLGVNADQSRAANQPQTIHPSIGQGTQLDGTIDYLTTTWPNYEPAHRQSFLLNVQDRLSPLLRGKRLVNAAGVPWHSIETGEDVTRCLRGDAVGVDLPEVEHGRAGVIVANLLKQRVYTQIKLRAGNGGEARWRAEGQTPVMFIFDECQLLVGQAELELIPIGRSLGAMFAMATQEIESLLTRFGDRDATAQFVNMHRNKILLPTSPATYEFIAHGLGTAMLVTYPQAAAGIDWRGAVRNAMASPINDLNHPNRSAMQKLERMGAGKLVVDPQQQDAWEHHAGRKHHSLADAAKHASISVPIGGTKEVQPIVKPEEFSALLHGRGQALVILNRAGVPRVDFATLQYVSEADARAIKKKSA